MRQLCLCTGTDMTVCPGHWVVVKVSALAQKGLCLYVTYDDGNFHFSLKWFFPNVFFWPLTFLGHMTYWDINNTGLGQCLHFFHAMYLSLSLSLPLALSPSLPHTHTRTHTHTHMHTHSKGHENRVNPWQLQWNLTQRVKLGGTREMQHRTVAWPPPATIDMYAPDTGRGRLSAQSQK